MTEKNIKCCLEIKYFLFHLRVFLSFSDISSAGKSVKLVTVATTSVNDVSHPRDWVPPNPLKTKIINPAIKTSEV